jgi:6-phosphogluconolactonase (cycloisomerase 2 family)
LPTLYVANELNTTAATVDFDRSGAFVMVANQDSDAVKLFAYDAGTGSLF